MRLSKYVFPIECKGDKSAVYLFNSAITRVCKVKKKILEDIFNNRMHEEENAVFRFLSKNIFIVPNDSQEEHFCQGMLNRNQYQGKLLGITVLITDNCNLRCSHCYMNGLRSHSTMTAGTISALYNFLESIIKSNGNLRRIQLGIHGGEPLLHLDKLLLLGSKLKQLCVQNSVTLDVSLYTNGVLARVEDLQQLKACYGVQRINISLDGPKEIHDKIRYDGRGNGSFDVIKENIISILRDTDFTLRLVTILKPDLYKAQIQIIKEVRRWRERDHGSRIIGIDFGFVMPNLSKPLAGQSVFPYKLRGQAVLDVLRMSNANQVPIFLESKFLPVHCAAFMENNYVIDPTGNIYKCNHFIGLKEFCIGNVEDGIDILKHHALISGPSDMFMMNMQCHDCKYSFICHGGCRIDSLAYRGDYHAIECPKEYYDAALVPMIKSTYRIQ